MTNCLANPHHAHCTPVVTEAKNWPARILRITNKNMVKLVDFDSRVMPGNYAALSYCWGSGSDLPEGGPAPYLANSNTCKRLLVGVPASDLGLTLQHAIQVCIWLDIGYIWIDSLCILQDSQADWEVQAAKMEAVYTMAKVTIIAASATSFSSGFLHYQQNHPMLFPQPLGTVPRFQVLSQPERRAIRASMETMSLFIRTQLKAVDGPSKKRFYPRGIISSRATTSSGSAMLGPPVHVGTKQAYVSVSVI